MPPAPFQHDEELASVLTYVRRSWGNVGDPVTPAQVKQVRDQTRGRAGPWTAEELDAIK
jgi:mono/diheme cytochrome c family protein